MTERIVGPHPACDCIARQVLHDQRCAVYRAEPEQNADEERVWVHGHGESDSAYDCYQNAAATTSPADGVTLSDGDIDQVQQVLASKTDFTAEHIGNIGAQLLAAVRLKARVEELVCELAKFAPIDGDRENTSLENWFPISAQELTACKAELAAFKRPVDIDGMIYWGSCPHGVARQQVVPADYAIRLAAQLRAANERIAQINAELEQFKQPCEDVEPLINCCMKPDDCKWGGLECNSYSELRPTIQRLAAQLRAAQEELARYRDKALPLLQRIARGPIMPLPDPVAHSWQAFGTRAHSALCDSMSLANEALRALKDKPCMQVDRDAAIALSDRSAGKIHSDLKDRNEVIRAIEDKP